MFYLFPIIWCFIITGNAALYWTDLRVTFSPDPSSGFYQIPRLQSNATDWVSISNDDCTNSGKFNGYRYVPKEYVEKNDSPIVVIFDKQGSIAGLQFRVPWSVILYPGSSLNIGRIPMYQNDTDADYMVITAYFEHPDTICKVGRNEYQLEEIGTCDGLWFQNGVSPAYAVQIPKVRSYAIQEGWTNNSCFPAMGVHNFYEVDTWDTTSCSQIRPAFLLYNHANELQGFGMLAAGKIVNKYVENPPYAIIKQIIAPNNPVCIKGLADKGLSSMHVYFLDKPWTFAC